jgi:hypothetical protein
MGRAGHQFVNIALQKYQPATIILRSKIADVNNNNYYYCRSYAFRSNLRPCPIL